MGVGPAAVIPCMPQTSGHGLLDDVEYWEINEAFAAQFIGVDRMLQEEQGLQNRSGQNQSQWLRDRPGASGGLHRLCASSSAFIMRWKGWNLTVGGASLCVGGGPAIASCGLVMYKR